MDPNPKNLPLEGGNSGRDELGRHVVSEAMIFKDIYLQDDDLAMLPRSQDVFRKIELDDSLSLSLPRPGATAGAVLRHCVEVFERLLEKINR